MDIGKAESATPGAGVKPSVSASGADAFSVATVPGTDVVYGPVIVPTPKATVQETIVTVLGEGTNVPQPRAS